MIDRYQSEYLWSTLEQVEKVEQMLTDVKAYIEDDDFHFIMRIIHSIKGTAGDRKSVV